MATLESNKVDKALMSKMGAERKDSGDWLYLIRNSEGIIVASTSLSKGAKHTLSPHRVSEMSRQLMLNKSQQFVDLVSCSLSCKDALKIMEEKFQ